MKTVTVVMVDREGDERHYRYTLGKHQITMQWRFTTRATQVKYNEGREWGDNHVPIRLTARDHGEFIAVVSRFYTGTDYVVRGEVPV